MSIVVAESRFESPVDDALCDFCSTEEQLVHEVAVTVIHEIAHHFGIEEHTLHALGWG